jgi:hypothetical protein
LKASFRGGAKHVPHQPPSEDLIQIQSSASQSEIAFYSATIWKFLSVGLILERRVFSMGIKALVVSKLKLF